ncbi:MAG: tetratricopeptide repeat protein [Gammaproteobacteria bacterium]|nr:tetratricopeptide repeat protein [Gammaproteobacteria bacterium]MDH3428585.1 tetratricopeptide repeat protein [Gammaproteobacteria bacterium]MDH3432391.1 tetratricopeptide repeat protein [Gammaproteobacteria bacterium]
MKFGAIVVAALILSAIAAHFLLGDPGYVAINVRGYLIEMSVPVLVGLAVLLVVTVWLLRRLIQAPRRLGEAAGRYRAGRAGLKLTRGMIEVAEGNFARGEKLLARAASTSDTPLFNYLQAARAAHLQGNDTRRDEWLKLAYEHTPEAANAVLLTQAEFQLDREQYEQALATLRRLEENSRDHSHALALLGRLYFRLQDWTQLADILPRLQKQGRVKQETLDAWTVRVHREKFERAADGEAVIAEWKNTAKRLRANTTLLDAYYMNLMRTGMHDKAEKDLATALKSEWRPSLVRLFGLVEGPDPSKQLKRAEGWLAKHGEDPDLLLAAARLCLRNELWGKARSYLETVISLRATPEAYQEYGRLLTQLGETDAAADAYREGLGMVAEGPLPAIPHLQPDKV